MRRGATHLFVDTRRLRLRLERRGRTVLRARIGVGQSRWPTPRGEFYVRNELRGFDSPIYGPVAFGTSARSAVLTDWPGGGFIGIHGTNQRSLLPGRVSHGCIRLRHRDIRRLARLMPVGTPLTITVSEVSDGHADRGRRGVHVNEAMISGLGARLR